MELSLIYQYCKKLLYSLIILVYQVLDFYRKSHLDYRQCVFYNFYSIKIFHISDSR